MTEVAKTTKKKEFQFSVNEDHLGIVTVGDTKIEVSSDGKEVSAYTDNGVEIKAATAAEDTTEGTKISISKDSNVVVLNGVTIEQAADGHLVITASGVVVINKPAPANDTAIKAAKDALELGAQMADGSVFAGFAADGKLILAMPNDLAICMTFNDAAKAVERLNSNQALGHSDWQMPDLENLYALRRNQNEGALKGTFKTVSSKGFDFPNWYWLSADDRVNLSYVRTVRFSDGYDNWCLKNRQRLSCRPVRLVAASAAPAPVN